MRRLTARLTLTISVFASLLGSVLAAADASETTGAPLAPAAVGAADPAPVVGYTPVVMSSAERAGATGRDAVKARAKHWYVKGRLGAFHIRETRSATSRILETVPAGRGAWCWNQQRDCGPAYRGGKYRCSSSTPQYSDWIPVATSNRKKGWVARHCVYATYE
ncbi:hypothetical protein [Carbonactinospora thermoautotrophica]|uniref:hypothetical protein n=1 Tax=Carbonactinospora thermoautotrophica TaxID=1469144 RepID=UPI00226F4844|nr:hypothetical protein [Carbonactinospora thermoautotrophica]